MQKHAGRIRILISAFAAFPAAGRPAAAAGVAPPAGIAESLREAADLLQGLNTFISGISFVSDTIGFSTIILFITVLFFSAGYAAAGVPRGKASFLAALVTADVLWLLWKTSFGAGPAVYLPAMARANCIVLAPMAAAILLSRIYPFTAARVRRAAHALFRKRRGMSKERLLGIYGRYEAHGARLNEAIMADVLAAGGETVTLSSETRMNIDALRQTLSELDHGGGGDTQG